MQRQRCVMNAMLRQLDPAGVIAHFEDIAAASSKVVSTDLPSGELGRFVRLAAGARSQPLTSVQFVPPLLDPAHPDLAVLRAKVAETIRTVSMPPPSTPATRSATPSATSSSASASRAPSTGQDPKAAPATGDVQSVCAAG
jgi:hypothetical protein